MLWHVVASGYSDAFDIMAVDEALFAVACEKHRPPVLRLYGWRPVAVSIGYFQRADDIADLRQHPHAVDFVRRATGGSAILHARELTYSICIHSSEATGRRATEMLYIAANKALLGAFRALGVRARMLGGEPPPQNPLSPFCFAKPSRFDIVAGGRKLVGSAQRRRGPVILQHGSIPLQHACDLPEATSLEAEASRSISFEEAVECVLQGFESQFRATLDMRALSDRELKLAGHLVRSKYRTAQWNFRR